MTPEVDIIFRAIDKASGEIKKINKSLDEQSSNADKLKTAFASIGAGMTAMIGVGVTVAKVLGDIADETANYSLQMNDLSKITGMSVEETSRLVQVADDYRVESGAVAQAMKMMVKNGFEPSIDSLAKLADRYKSIEDPNQRAAELTALMGRNWTELIPLLEAGGDAIRDGATAIDSALVVTQAQVQAAKELKKAQDDLNDSWTATKMTLGNAVIPQLADVLKGINLATQAAKEGGNALAVYNDYVQQQADKLRGLAGSYEERAQAERDAIGLILQEVDATQLLIDAARKEINAQDLATYQREQAMGPLKNERQLMMEAADAAHDLAFAHTTEANAERVADKRRLERLDVLGQLKDAENQLTDAEKNFAQTLGGDVAQGLKNAGLSAKQYREALGLIDETLGTNLGQQQDYNDAIANLIKTYDPSKPEEFKAALAGLKEAFAPMDEGIKESMKLVEELDAKYKALSGQSVAMYVDVYLRDHTGQLGGGTKNPAPGQNKKAPPPEPFASGGYPDAGTWAILGERGPEPVYFGNDARVFTAADFRSALAGTGGYATQPPVTVNQYITANTPLDYELIAQRTAEIWERRRR